MSVVTPLPARRVRYQAVRSATPLQTRIAARTAIPPSGPRVASEGA
jgi:hypothetical protein